MVLLKGIWGFFISPLFSMGDSIITLWTIIAVTGLSILLVVFTKKLKRWIVYTVFAKSAMELGARDALASIFHYLILSIGFAIIIQTMGVDISSLTILFGALGVGVGFGLQSITNNFVSGMVILFERPIKLGDRIEVGSICGNVTKISMRATTIITNDNISVIVPNSDFVSSTVINWSYTDRNVRFNIPVGVSYAEDPAAIKRILLEVARAEPGVLDEPPPDVLFDSYGDSAINFNLRVWSFAFIDKPNILKSRLYYAIFDAFKKEGVEIPFPQRDIHIKDDSALRSVTG